MILAEVNGGKLSIDSIWRTQVGEDIPLSEMETEHVVNTLNMLERQETQHIGTVKSIEALQKELIERDERT